MLQITPSETNILQPGQEAVLLLKEHGSVGIRSAATSSDESIIRVTRSHFDYHQPSPRQPGGDAGTRTYRVTAVQAGTTTLETRRIFRGRVEKIHLIPIKVTE